jgi:glycosyltransferase involved in cell wall biosynthesis
VIHPPVDVSAGKISDQEGGGYYIAIGRLVEYKRFDLVIAACTKLQRRLKIIGIGPQEKLLRRMAGPTVEFLGRVNDVELRENLAGCRALLFPGEEDFGIVPVEAQSFGKPVIAYASGGVLETVRGIFSNEAEVEDPTGVFFTEKSLSGLTGAMLQFESMEHKFRPEIIRKHSLQFDSAIFERRISEFIASAVKDFRARNQADNVCADKVFDLFAGT